MKFSFLLLSRHVLNRLFRFTGVIFLVLAGVSVLHAGCIDLADVPLDTQEQSAPGIVMFLIDDSGSMDWSAMCPPPESSGVFSGYEYIFSDPGDDNYTSDPYDDNLEDSVTNKMRWKSQWSGYNSLYYNPGSIYTPWPTKTNADPDDPRSNPVNSGSTLDLSHIYHQFAGDAAASWDISDDGVVIVDNENTPPPPVQGDPIIMDNLDPGFSESDWSGGNWKPWTSSKDYGSNYLYSSTKGSYRARWDFSGLSAGNYNAYVWYVDSNNRATDVHYLAYDQNGNQVAQKYINQRNNGGKWVLLGENLSFDGNARIELRHDCRSTSKDRCCADAAMLIPIEIPPAGDVLFEASTNWSEYTTGNQIGDNYLYSADTGSYWARWTANNLDPAVKYHVLVNYEARSYRSDNVHYVINGITYSVSQRVDGSTWVLLAADQTFASGVGTVYLEHYVDSTSWDSVSADAVAFVPAVPIVNGDIDINRSHYYVQNNGSTFLVNLNGDASSGAFEYYRFTDKDSDDKVEDGELELMTIGEATASNLVTNRTYAEERQNFANWYSFYRRRELTAKNAVANVINSMQGVYIGFMSVNGGLKQYALPVRVTLGGVTYDQTAALLNTLYAYNSNGSTPLRNGLKSVGLYFKGENMGTGLYPSPLPMNTNTDSYPFFIADKGGTCEQVFCIAMTDGYYNGSVSGFGNEDGDNDTDFDGPPFADSSSSTLADIAMYFYENDLKTNLTNDVPVSTQDPADHQHMVTYTLSFGVEGTLDRTLTPDCPQGTCPTWPAISGDAQKIDDMYHAAVNGRGKYVSANSPEELVDALNELKQDILSRLGSAAALATNSIRRQIGSTIYQGTYNTDNWFGDVTALPVNVKTGDVGEALWSANHQLDLTPWHERTIFTFNGSSGVMFDYSQLTEGQRTALDTDPATSEQLSRFIRGDTSNDYAHGGPFRVRNSKLGDIVHSAPVYYRGALFIGANDGMLHAFNAMTGDEMFAYVPNLVFDHLKDLAETTYSHKYFVDNTPYVANLGSVSLLVSGLRKGGKGYFCMDVSNPVTMDASDVKWEYPTTQDNDMGYSFSRAFIVKTQAAGWVVIFGNGYDSVNQSAILYVLDASTGMVIRKFDTQVEGCNGLSTPAVVDVDVDGNVDYAFAGDLLGNLWKFDLRGEAIDDWKIAFNNGVVDKPLITVRNGNGQVQPITTVPEVMSACQDGEGYVVIFGTGQYLNSSDFDDTRTQSFYGVWDWQELWEDKESVEFSEKMYLGIFNTDRFLSNISENPNLSDTGQAATLLQQSVSSSTAGWVSLTGNDITYYNPRLDTGSHLGWYFNLPTEGERNIRDPFLREGVAVMIGTIPSNSPCSSGGSSVLYQIDACSGGRTDSPQFDTNGDNIIDENDDPGKTGQKLSDIVFEPIQIEDRYYMPDAFGNINDILVPPDPPGRSYWRIID